MQQEELGLARLLRPPLHSVTLSLGHAGSPQTSALPLSLPSNLCLCLSVDGFLQALPCLTWMPSQLHHHHLHHHLPQLSRRAVSSWRSELDTQCFFLPDGCGETAAQPAGGEHAVILQPPYFTLKGWKRNNNSGEYTNSGNKNPVHHTSTMKITSLLIFNARVRCTVRLLLLLLHCVGYSHGMPHVLRFGELLLLFPLM